MTYLCIARRDLREGPDLEVGFYQAKDPQAAAFLVRETFKSFPPVAGRKHSSFSSITLGKIAVYTVNDQTCMATLVWEE